MNVSGSENCIRLCATYKADYVTLAE